MGTVARQGEAPVPDDLPRSPTGRIPQWVLDEAAGRPVDVVPFRASPSGPGRGARARRARSGRGLTVFLVALIVAGAFVLRPLSTGSTVASLVPHGAPTVVHVGDVAPSPSAAPSPPRARPPAGLGESPDTRPAQAVVEDGQGFRYLRHQADGIAPVTWSPCRAVHYVTRSAGQPRGGAALLASAVAAVSRATGLRFVDDGATTEGPSEDRAPYQPQRYGDRWAPVLVAWATPDEVPDFGVDVAGEAGPVTGHTPSGDDTYVSGTVYLDAGKLQAAGPGQARGIIEHELGHLVGLAHVSDPGQLMFPRAGRVTTYAAGDRAGLAALSRGACQPDA